MEKVEPSNKSQEIIAVHDEVRLQRCLAVFQNMTLGGMKLKDACEAANLPERTFTQWVGNGALRDYLAECRSSRHEIASTLALEAVPDVLNYLIKIATGQTFARGTPPHVAAEMVFAAASGTKVTSAAEDQPDRKSPVIQFFPQSMTFVRVDGALQPVIEGEAEELSSDAEDDA